MGQDAAQGAVDWHHQIADSFQAGYNRSPGFMERLALWRGLIGQAVQPGDRVLDAGCGAGTFSFLAAERAGQVRALDGADAMIALCKAEQAKNGLSNISFETGMLDVLSDWEAAQFDVVLSSSVLEYVPAFEETLAQMARVLKPGGRMIISMPNGLSRYRQLERLAFRLTGKPRYYAYVCNIVTPDQLSQMLAANGLSVGETHYYAEPPLPLGLGTLLGGPARRRTLFAQVARKAG